MLAEELAEARRRGLRVLHRSEALAAAMTGRETIAVAGTHGKTTTTSLVAALLDAGASDAWLTPIQMKKGRPAVTVSVLAPVPAADALRRVLFRETSTIGLREREVAKRSLDRSVETVTLADGAQVRVKVARLDGEVVNAVPEFEDVAALAAKRDRPVKAVLAEANAAAAGLLP